MYDDLAQRLREKAGARIGDLKRLGVNIESEMKTNPATGKRWKEYRLCTR